MPTASHTLRCLPVPMGALACTREDVLAQCIAQERRWAHAPGRQLVLLFDGTGNILGNRADTNVVKLMRALAKHGPHDARRPAQVVYYDPGVGTNNEFPAAGWSAWLASALRQARGLALGSGAFENIAQAYEFLVREHREGDRIFLFGFSRGAFCARAVSGMVNMFGLVHTSGLPLLRSLVRAYFAAPSDDRQAFAADVVMQFSVGRQPLVHFVGVWDTVETIGSGMAGGVRITNSRDLADKRIVHVRHAMALHETRAHYLPRDFTPPQFSAEELAHRSFDQRWFRGVHSDIGGSYARAGLSDITLAWMAREAQACGLMLDGPLPLSPDPATPLHDQTLESPGWVWTGLDSREREAGIPVDSTAQPVTGATPAARSVRGGMVDALGWLVALLALALGGWSAGLGGAGDAPAWQGWRHAAFLVAYAVALAWPMAWALRRWCHGVVGQGTRLPWLGRKTHRFMQALVLADAARLAHGAWPLRWGLAPAMDLALQAVMAASALALLAVLLQAALALTWSRRPSGR